MFPTKQVEEIIGKVFDGKGDTYRSWEGGTLDELRQLIDIGAADPMECQNSSPSIGYFLKELEPFKEKVKLIGYVIYPPRSDARVSVEGFDIFGITADEVDALMDKFGGADETDKAKNGGLYDLHFWWD